MATLAGRRTGIRSTPGVAARVARAWRAALAVVSTVRRRSRRPVLTTAGLGCMAAAGYQVSVGVGLLVTGAACLIFEWATSDQAGES